MEICQSRAQAHHTHTHQMLRVEMEITVSIGSTHPTFAAFSAKFAWVLPITERDEFVLWPFCFGP